MRKVILRKTTVVFFFLAVIGLIVNARSGISAPPETKFDKIRIASPMPVGHYTHKALTIFANEAQKRSNGTLNFLIYPAQQLYQDKEICNVLPKGGIEMAQSYTERYSGILPEVEVLHAIGFFKDVDHWYRFFYDTKTGGGYLYKVLDQTSKEKTNTKFLGTNLYSPTNSTIFKADVTTIDGFKGKKVRVASKASAAMLAALGSSPVVMTSSDVYMALQRGILDGANTGITSFYERKWYEIAKYVAQFYDAPAPYCLIANLDFWKKLSPNQKKALDEATRISELYCLDGAIKGEAEATQGLIKNGVKVYNFPPDQQIEIHKIIRDATRKNLQKAIGEKRTNDALKLIDSCRNATSTAVELIQSRHFVD